MNYQDATYSSRPNQARRKRRVESRLPIDGQENVGTATVILASGANGRGERDTGEAALFAEKAFDLAIALRGNLLKRFTGRSMIEELAIVEAASKADLRSAIQDVEVKNIYLMGHSTYHSVALTDGSADWHDVGMMVDGHQKNGVFANLGCGIIIDKDPIPLGRYAISANGRLLGKEDSSATFSEMSDLRQYSVLTA